MVVVNSKGATRPAVVDINSLAQIAANRAPAVLSLKHLIVSRKREFVALPETLFTVKRESAFRIGSLYTSLRSSLRLSIARNAFPLPPNLPIRRTSFMELTQRLNLSAFITPANTLVAIKIEQRNLVHF
jgi:hypothetical protein